MASERQLVVMAMVVVAGCVPRQAGERGDRGADPARRSATVAGVSAATTLSASASPPPGGAPAGTAEPVASESAEATIRALLKLDRDGGKAAELDSYVTEHPTLLTAAAKPYGAALMWALEFEHGEAALALIRAGAATKGAKAGQAGPIHIAARGGLDGVVAELLARGASANGADYWGTPLHFAAKHGHTGTMKLLLAAGADPSTPAQDHQFTPLHGAVIGRHLDAIRVLIAAKADLEATDDDGRRPLHWGGFAYVPQAVHRYERLGEPHDTTFHDPGPAVGMKLLLDAGARMDAVDGRGNTPLHAAAEVGSLRGVELLVHRGARRGVKNREGKTALDLARRRGNGDVVRLLSGRP